MTRPVWGGVVVWSLTVPDSTTEGSRGQGVTGARFRLVPVDHPPSRRWSKWTECITPKGTYNRLILEIPIVHFSNLGHPIPSLVSKTSGTRTP